MNLVTGATGSLGMYIVRELLANGDEVRGLSRPDSNRARTESFLARHLGEDGTWRTRFSWASGDVLDGFSLEEALTGARRVYHAAALVSFHSKDTADMMAINREGTAHLVNAMLHVGVRDLVHISSVAALGRKAGEPVHEDTPFEDGPEVSAYGRSKHMAEREAWRGQEEGLRVMSINPVVILGEGDYTKSSAALFRMVDKGLSWYPMGENGFVAASDVARASVQLAAKGAWGERFLLSAENRSYLSVLTAMATALQRRPPSRALQPWMMGLAWRVFAVIERITGAKAQVTKASVANTGRVHHYASDKVERTLPGWQYTPVDQAIAEVAEAYRSTAPGGGGAS